ncbi:MAG: hypothetical protein ACM3Q2_03505 [Syntrophothermus sp.]
MWKIKTFAIITVLLGIISFGFIVYDYFALTEILYNRGDSAALTEKLRIITLGFIPIVLFHIALFVFIYLLFAYLKAQKTIAKEYMLLKAEFEKNKSAADNIATGPGKEKSQEP